MMEILICALKWIVAGLAGPAFSVVFIFVMMSAAHYGTHAEKKLLAILGSKAAERASMAFVLFVAIGVVSIVVYSSARIIMPKFGCDDCLPESWQEQCTIGDRDRMEQADRRKAGELTAEIRAMCDRWSWTDCPVSKE